MNLRRACRIALSTLALASTAAGAHAVSWFPLGPYGGDTRSFAGDPANSRHIYLGTATGWLYESMDGGNTWTHVSQVSKRDDLVLDHILIDPTDTKHIIVGAFTIDKPDGGIFISDDSGRTWYEQAEMRGQSVRSVARSPSDPNILIAGTLQGVYRSHDDGKHWSLISPVGSTELHEVESVAFDPVNPQIMYAGTWHLPWKTMDGGEHWTNIKEGIIDDSDVFSIIVDPVRANVVYASACSGIYKSTTAAMPNPAEGGKRFVKIQGIPSTARRTRKLLQDPSNPDTVYAGTTEGLYKTIDGGATFLRMTSPTVIINDVYVDPKDSNHVLLATDRGGVLNSEDGGVAFQPTNTGFSTQQVSAYASDPANPATIYVGVLNDKDLGGVFKSTDGGLQWQQNSQGLGGRDIFSLTTSSAGTLLAGTSHGMYRLVDGGWLPSSGTEIVVPAAARPEPRYAPRSTREAAARPIRLTSPTLKKGVLDTMVYSLLDSGGKLYAGTALGLYSSNDDGNTWMPVTSLKLPEAHFMAASDSMLMVAGLRRIALSVDGGVKWDSVALPADLTQISSVGVDSAKNLWVGGTEGVYYSTDYGLTWRTLHNLALTEVTGLFFDKAANEMLVTSVNQIYVFAVHLPEYQVKAWDAGWKLRFMRPVGDYFIGATLFDGMVVQPKMIATPIPKQ
jgi:photosystem II stability/assembly factor-like uncharacterized protein